MSFLAQYNKCALVLQAKPGPTTSQHSEVYVGRSVVSGGPLVMVCNHNDFCVQPRADVMSSPKLSPKQRFKPPGASAV